jgi:DnaJ-domain-containing protein 1
MLLFAVAEVDGASEREERELVRHFVLQRFTDPVYADDLRSWEAQRVPPEQVGVLAMNMGQILTDSERETVFAWCCLVAFADGKFHPEEHMLLQEIARCFHMEPYQARRIFHYARQAHMSGQATAAGLGGRGRTSGSRARGAVSGTSEALAVLGLEEGATQEEIRGRHRELVKRYHPDKHTHLGPVAAKEAEQRFREVQAAYEVLGG